MLATLKRYLNKQSWQNLPLDQLYLPFVLTMLPSVSSLWGMGLLCGGTLGVHLYLSSKQKVKSAEQHLGLSFKFGAICLILYLRPICLGSPLSLQFIWLLLYFIWHTGRYMRSYWRSYQQPLLSKIKSSHLRIGALRKEYNRFDRILIAYSLTVCFIIYILLASNIPLAYHWIGSLLVNLSIWTIFALELTHLAWVKQQLHEERWISVLGKDNKPIDRVPSSVGRSQLGRMPLIRLLIWSQDMVYLERCTEHVLDTPFVSWQFEDETPAVSALRLISERLKETTDLRPRHLLSYQGQYGDQTTLTQLFTIELSSPHILTIACSPKQGKWWSIEHLNLPSIKSEVAMTLADELPYLKQTMLFAQKLRACKAMK